MEKIEKLTYYNELFDLYEHLLTVKQSTYFKAYYFDDQTLQEIGDEHGVSRNAVFDQLSKVISNLEHYESVLHLLELKVKRASLWKKYDQTKDTEVLEELRKLDLEDGK